MEELTFKTWETINLMIPVDGECYYTILDHEYVGDADPSEDEDIIYAGYKPEGIDSVNGLNEILSPIVTKYSLHSEMWSGWADYPYEFYVYYTYNNWEYYDCILLKITYDWTYDSSLPYNPTLTNPIQTVVDYRQRLIGTFRQTVPGTFERYRVYVDGVDIGYNIPMDVEGATYTLSMYLPDYVTYEGTDKVIEYGPDDSTRLRVTMTDTCRRYCLYWLNRTGGWEWLLIDGRQLKSDEMTRLKYKRNNVAQLPLDMNTVNYSTVIAEKYEFTTSWLDDSKADRISDLLESNKVFLQDLETGSTFPVLITNTSVDYKTYLNQGRRLYAYTINVESANPKYRYDAFKETPIE